MNFPGGDHLRRIRKALFPTDAELAAECEAGLAAIPAEVEAELEARRLAREAEARELRHSCANRLRPYIGRLILVTNFQGVWPEENAARIRSAVLTPANFGAEMPIGIQLS